ncbi:hypothetical protein OG897_26725 [Streptomyces sp. NBC_00237]|uniref:hypothetical protein n=1 Tax=Streptomyces sp. NBC_00237 TaxID=2975687 RepID=UPI002259E0E1|nr:hypothetical protein [Streptomyces sp. NBC_00237]MCX5205039.1 hypothetical protein [Streptomyces sp. NBC_00237]
MATALSTDIQQRIVAETGSAAPTTDDAVAFEAWVEGLKGSNDGLFEAVASEIEELIMGKMA